MLNVSTRPRRRNAGRPAESREKWRSATRTCEQCGKVFGRADKPGTIYSAFMKRRFCSPDCAATSLRADPVAAFWSKVKKGEACWIWTGGLSPKGYGIHWIGKGHKRAHRYVYELVHGVDPGPRVVMHTCDVRNCVNPDHLRLGTQRDNIADMDRKSRRGSTKGERHHAAVLTPEQAAAIRSDLRPSRQIAESGEYPIGRSGIEAIKAGRTWRHI